MNERLKGLYAERARAYRSMLAINEEAGDRALTAEERQKWDAIEADMQSLESRIRDTEQLERLESVVEAEVRDAHIDAARSAGASSEDVDNSERYDAAFRHYVRHGGEGLTAEQRSVLQAGYQVGEQRAQSEGTTTAGGYLVPTGYRAVITERMKAFGGFMNLTNQIHTGTGITLPWPNNDDTSNVGALLSENAQVSEVDLTVGQKQLNAWTYTSNLVLVSLQLLQDSAFDLDSWLPKKLATRLGRAIAADLVTGNGTSRPTGIDNAPTVGITGPTGTTTAALWAAQSAAAASDQLVNLVHSLDPAYRQNGNCRFVLNDATVAAIRTVKDSQGRPLWLPAFGGFATTPDDDTIMGYPVVVDQAMPVMAANALSILFGDFEAGYITRWVQDPTFMRLTERYADFLQVGYFGFMRVDGKPDDSFAVVAFKNSAT